MKFFIVEDPLCKFKFGFELLDPVVVMTIKDMDPSRGSLTAPDQDLSYEHLLKWIPLTLAQNQYKYSKRTLEMLQTY